MSGLSEPYSELLLCAFGSALNNDCVVQPLCNYERFIADRVNGGGQARRLRYETSVMRLSGRALRFSGFIVRRRGLTLRSRYVNIDNSRTGLQVGTFTDIAAGSNSLNCSVG